MIAPPAAARARRRHAPALALSIVLSLVLAHAACATSTPIAPEPAMSTPTPAFLASRERLMNLIAKTDAAELAWSASSAQKSLAGDPDARAAALDIAHDAELGATTRMKAYEAYVGLGGSIDPAESASAAQIYAAALTAEKNGHDAWGYPGLSPSGAGRRVVGFGPAAVDALLPLLDSTILLVYEGSEEPTVAEMRRYRVKDLAATWLAVLLGASFDGEVDDPAQRDPAIAELARQARARH
ncbi:MAG: hypothetical protein U1F43_05455 [Myxococcota bacterium]